MPWKTSLIHIKNRRRYKFHLKKAISTSSRGRSTTWTKFCWHSTFKLSQKLKFWLNLTGKSPKLYRKILILPKKCMKISSKRNIGQVRIKKCWNWDIGISGCRPQWISCCLELVKMRPQKMAEKPSPYKKTWRAGTAWPYRPKWSPASTAWFWWNRLLSMISV